MSERTQTKSPSPPVVEVGSEDESLTISSIPASSALRQPSVIDVTSDISEDEEVEIVAEHNNFPDADDVEITGHSHLDSPVYEIEYPGGPPSRSISREAPPARPIPRHRSRNEPVTRNVRRRRNPPHGRNFYQASFAYDFSGSPLLSHHDIPAMLAAHQHRLLHMLHSPEGEVSAAIMDRINRAEEHTLDRKIESENKHNKNVLEKKKGISSAELDGYTNNIAEDDNLMCELCGVVLGEGIPADFEPDPKYDDALEQHASVSQVKAPWFCIRQCFSIDKDLSKRVFAAKCGHVFCGRCMKNIGNRLSVKGGKRSNDITILNPNIYAPRKCPAKECGVVFKKSKFTELFL